MATKKAKVAAKAQDPEKEAKRKARMEALKNRPAGQRSNSKQIDVIELGNGNVVKNFGYPVKSKLGHEGILVTSVVLKGEEVVSTSVTFVPGNLTIKAKKGHGAITTPKVKTKKASEESEKSEEAED